MSDERKPQQQPRPQADPEKSALLALVQSLQARLDALELSQRQQAEAALNPRAKIEDEAYQKWKAEASRPASERTQDIADARYGKAGPRFRVRLDTTGEDGRPGPKVAEHFPLVLSATDETHAKARYQEIMGIRGIQHDYKFIAELAA